MKKSKDFDWAAYKALVVRERVEQFKTVHGAIIEMDAIIASLKVEIKALQEMITWDECDD